MGPRWGLGPVFVFEQLVMSRRWQVYAGRAVFVGMLLAGITLVWLDEFAGQSFTTIQAQSRVGESFYETIVGIQLALVLLAAPAATAGAVCLDKARGTLEHLLLTDLSDAEIVLGKLGARLVPVVGTVACALPVMALATLLGGIDPLALTGAFIVTVGVAVLSCALALTLSVWGRKTHEVLTATYVALILWLLAVPLGALFFWNVGGGPAAQWWWIRSKVTNPFYLAFAPYADPGAVSLGTDVAFFTGCLLTSAALAALAVVRVRSVATRQAGRVASVGRRWALPDLRWPRLPGWRGPSLDDNPVLWREWHRRRPSRWSRVVWAIYALLAAACSLLALREWARMPRGGPGGEFPGLVNAFQVAIGLLLLSVASATSLAEERLRGSLDVLLATPLSTRTILWGKWYGAFRPVPRLAILPLGVACCLAARSGYSFGVVFLLGLLLAYGAAITSLGLALATWLPRLGRAVGATVAAYVVFTVGWIILVATVFRNANSFSTGLAVGSPFFGLAFGTMGIEERQFMPRELKESLWLWVAFWTLAHSAAAAALFVATLRTFDRCLGRAPETPLPVRLEAVSFRKPERVLELE
jgi:ABC-type transport system involved in multi-copper enzyme maturation permease subunit